ncbi:GroES-like protein [Macrolepiota fuliginosa MF-IS2]|uniref:GroES-like protein n=1 Tax=Macrolepiota fuliginosa MF-IS2 TaxID=1400762 RepID=A0A9P6C170_9AGAR|nr:GroES-like protein [Macrolepiota fuliginosa MF-IS2]
MASLPSKQKALLLESQQGNFILGTNVVHRPGAGQLLLRIKATALNPVDWKIQKHGIFINEFPAVLGTDLAGEVVALGEGVTKFQVGDRVFCQGRFTNDYASFQEYTLADEHHLAKIPSNITYDQACTIPLGLTTAYVSLYNTTPHGIGLVSPVEPAGQGHYKGEPILVLGGATSVGQFAIQLAKLSGFSPIITTASPKHIPYLKSLGATHVLDRHLSLPDLKSEIAKITTQPIKYVYDAVSLPDTQHIGNEILAPGGYLMLVLSPTITSEDKHVNPVLAMRQLDHNVKLLTGLYSKLTGLVESDAIKPNKVELLPGGLNGIVEGLKKMERDQVSGVKLVVRPEETTVAPS